jgi:hypothetical protein
MNPRDNASSTKHHPKGIWSVCLLVVLNCVCDYFHPLGILFDVFVLIPLLLFRVMAIRPNSFQQFHQELLERRCERALEALKPGAPVNHFHHNLTGGYLPASTHHP